MRMGIKIILLVSILLIAIPAGAETYDEIRDEASGNTANVLTLYMDSAVAIDSDTSAEPPVIETDYSDLMAAYEDAAARNPLTALAERYLSIHTALVHEITGWSDEDVMLRLSGDVDEELVLAVLIARSPRLSRAEHAWRASLNRYPQTTYLQDVLYQYRAFTEGMALGTGREYQRGMVQMNYASQGMLTLRGDVVELDIEIAWNDYIREGTEIIADAKSVLAEIRNKDGLIAINSSSVSRLYGLGAVVEAQYIAGMRSFADLVRIRTELASRNDMLERVRSMRDGLTGRLASMLSIPATSEFGPFTWGDRPDVELSETSLIANLEESRPELIQIARGVEKMDAMIEMTMLRSDPDQTFGFTYFQGRDVESADMDMDSGGMDGMDMDGGSDGMDMSAMNFMSQPMLDYRSTNYASDLACAAELIDRRDAMSDMLDAMTDMASGMLSMQIEKYLRASESTGVSSGRIIPNSRAALDVIRTGYTADENNFNDLIMAELSLLMARMDLANFQLEMDQALVEIERLTGGEL